MLGKAGRAAGAGMSANPNSLRLLQIDALRGVAALAVVFFHFTTRFTDLFHPVTLPTISVPYGHYGVNLFFIISGFVIFMTLEKTSRPMDFLVSRFSRLFPAYWAAIMLTFLLTHLLGLPGKLVDLPTVMANFLMLHGFFKVPHVDGVYWTLEVELLFYIGMLLLYRLGQLHRVHLVLLGLMALRLLYFVLEHGYGISLPWFLFRMLILQYIAWFVLGICIYQVTSRTGPKAWRWPALSLIFALWTLGVTESFDVVALAVFFLLMVWLAAQSGLTLLRYKPFVWLGAISYPLYLLHENIGWSLQLRLGALGLSTDLSIVVTLVLVVLLAAALTRWVEQPAMRWIRQRYQFRN